MPLKMAKQISVDFEKFDMQESERSETPRHGGVAKAQDIHVVCQSMWRCRHNAADRTFYEAIKEEAMKRCVRVVVSGKVQGVFFRAFTQEEAERLGLDGWVRNLSSGQVETLFYGPADKVEAMLAWLTEGSPQSRVDHLDYKEISEPPDSCGFEIRY